MSRHQSTSTGPTWRSRTLVGGAAMTAVLLGGGGTAMAATVTLPNGNSVDLPDGKVLTDVTGKTFDQLKALGLPIDTIKKILGDEKKNDHKNEDWKKNKHDWKKKHDHDHDIWGDKDDCGCDDAKPAKHKPVKNDEDCDEDEADKGKDVKDEDDKDDKDDEKKDEKADESKDKKVEDTKADEEKPEVEAAKADDSSTPEVKTVAAEDNSAATESGATPVGSADTGDGSFVGGVAPVASSWSMADTMFAAGGGVAAAALLAGAGVGVGRHRRAGHRAN